MNTNRIYHVVELLTTQNNLMNCVHCIPASWVRWQDKESIKVLVAYPDELEEITQERVKIYENPGGYWNMYWAKIKYTTDSYDSAIRGLNEQERSVEESSSEVIYSQIERPSSSVSFQTWQSSGMNDSNAFWPELQRWMDRLPNSDDSRMSMENRSDEVLSFDSGVSDPEDVDRNVNDAPLDLSMSSKTVQQSTRSLQDLRLAIDSNDSHKNRGTVKDLTVKYIKHAPGLTELIANSGVYIEERELENCLKSSRKCTELARYLTKHILTTTPLNVDSRSSIIEHQLRSQAITAIIEFVLNYSMMRGWHSSSEKSIYSAIWYQQTLLKKY